VLHLVALKVRYAFRFKKNRPDFKGGSFCVLHRALW